MFKIFEKVSKAIFGDKKQKDIQDSMPLVNKTNEEFAKLSGLSHDELRAKTQEFKNRIKNGLKEIDGEIADIKNKIKTDSSLSPDDKEVMYEEIDKLTKSRDKKLEEVLLEMLPEAFAVVKETARRFKENSSITVTASDLDRELSVNRPHITIEGNQATYQNEWEAAGNILKWEMVHYDVQLIGGIALHQGKIAEMQTGEGKTLVATLPAYLNGITGEGVHVVTVNNYLARRDCEWMGGLLNFMGLTVDCIDLHRPNTQERREAYLADVTYGTNNEYGFDYLRDNMCRQPEELVQRKHHYAMIDEVDSVLVDDARTPLIISGPIERGDEHEFQELKPRIEKLIAAQRKQASDSLIQAKKLISEGKTKETEGGLHLFRAHRGFPKNKALIKYLNEAGMKVILQKAENYFMAEQNKNMHVVDDELFFVIEERQNSVDLTEKGIELITKSGEDENFFIVPDIGSEMAEIENSALEDDKKQIQKDELLTNFAIKSERIHSVQQLLKAYAMFEKDVEYVVLDGKVKIVDEQTGRIMEGRRYSDGLHQAIEAKENVKVEAATQTFATISLQNYFRMYHKLAGMTGTAETEAGEFWDIYNLDVMVIPTNRPIQRDDRNDLVYKTKKEKFNAVIDEVVNLREAGRPVLVGTTSVEVSELLSRMLKMRGIDHNVLNAKQHSREADIVAAAGQAGTVTIATNMAGRGTDIKLGEGVKAAGGLAIIGTERHDSRRVDRQLRGRAGRQGDPGSSQFYVALDDNLMRLFGSERMAGIMDTLGHKEGDVIQHSMITKSIERAQKKVEENNFGQRKRLLEYDDVMNAQRQVIYKRRKHALFGERLSVDLYNSFYDIAEELILEQKSNTDYDEFKLDTLRLFAINTKITQPELQNKSAEELTTQLYNEATSAYERKFDQIIQKIHPFIEQVYHEKGEVVKNVLFPFTDGKKGMQISANLEKAYQTQGKSLKRDLEKSVALAFIDNSWKEHLREMDNLKQSVQLATLEQKDPLLIYKFEGFELFKQMVSKINREVASFLFKANLPVQDPEKVREAQTPKKTDMSRMQASKSEVSDGGMGNARQSSANTSQAQSRPEPVKVGPKVGRNEPCPCGSGKKFKHCHGRN